MDKGEKKKRLHVILDEEEEKKFELIRGFIRKKFGEGTATDASVVRAALLHLADHIERGELE
jgi:hypothetical protein